MYIRTQQATKTSFEKHLLHQNRTIVFRKVNPLPNIITASKFDLKNENFVTHFLHVH